MIKTYKLMPILIKLGACQRALDWVVFASLWDSINGEREGCSWAANPWVWAIRFQTRADGDSVGGSPKKGQ